MVCAKAAQPSQPARNLIASRPFYREKAVALADFSQFQMVHRGESRNVYKLGGGPGVVVLHVLPGIIPSVVDFAERIANEGFTVYMPHLFGVDGKPLTKAYNLAEFFRVCLRREFYTFAARKSSPISEWLRALCRYAHRECGGPGVGAVGMCFTGGFVLSMMVDSSVMAPVIAQPVLPSFPITLKRKAALGVARSDLACAAKRARNGAGLLGVRFTDDWLCPAEKFQTLRESFGDAFDAIEIDSSPGNAHGIPSSAHAVFTDYFVDQEGHPTHEALLRVIAMFRERLSESSTAAVFGRQ
jgi:dienelactone hydrolase